MAAQTNIDDILAGAAATQAPPSTQPATVQPSTPTDTGASDIDKILAGAKISTPAPPPGPGIPSAAEQAQQTGLPLPSSGTPAPAPPARTSLPSSEDISKAIQQGDINALTWLKPTPGMSDEEKGERIAAMTGVHIASKFAQLPFDLYSAAKGGLGQNLLLDPNTGTYDISPEAKTAESFASNPLRFGGSGNPLLSPAFEAQPFAPGFTPPKAIEGPVSVAAPPIQLPVAEPPAFVPPATSDEGIALASQRYADARAAGANSTPQLTDKVIDQIQALLPQDAFNQAIRGGGPLGDIAAKLDQFRGQSLTMDNIINLDKELGDNVSFNPENKKVTEQGRDLLQAQSTLRNLVRNPAPGDIAGDPSAVSSWMDAMKTYSQAMKMRDIENIQNRALGTKNPATSIQTQVNNFVNNDAKTRGYSDDEIADLSQAAKTGLLQDVVQGLGSRLVPHIAGAIGAGIGGIPGFVAGEVLGHIGSSQMRNWATTMQNRPLTNALQTVARGVPQNALTTPPP